MRCKPNTAGDRVRVRDDDAEELRCLCGSLLARLVPEGVEIKCRRCQRRVVLALEAERPAER